MAALAVWILLGPLPGEGAARLALLPFQNVSGQLTAPDILMPLLQGALQERGYEVVPPAALEPFLSRQRIRVPGKPSRAQLAALGREFDAPVALAGSIDLFAATAGNPQWGLSARLLDTARGEALWADAAGFTGDDFTGFLGLGTVTAADRLAGLTVERLLRSLPGPGAGPAGRPGAPARGGGRLTGGLYRDPRLDTDPPARVALLPFENGTERRGAALIVDDLMAVSLFHAGRVALVEPGEVLQALQALGATPYGAIDLETLRAIGAKTGADAVILGRVEDYNEGLRPGASTSPSIALDARMLETKSGKILWMASHEGKGEAYQTILEFGKIKSMVPLALRIIGELVGTIERGPAARPARSAAVGK